MSNNRRGQKHYHSCNCGDHNAVGYDNCRCQVSEDGSKQRCCDISTANTVDDSGEKSGDDGDEIHHVAQSDLCNEPLPTDISNNRKDRYCLSKFGKKAYSDGCSCGRCESPSVLSIFLERKANHSDLAIKVGRILISVILIVVSSAVTIPEYAHLILYVVAYICIGANYLYLAMKNILHGKIFDENFLMVVATVGAFAIGEYLEAVLVMELYFIGELLQDYAVDSSRRNIAALLNIKSPRANRLVNGELLSTDTDTLSIGDIIKVAAGEKVAVDGIVLDGKSYLDTSMLTGESELSSVGVGDEVIGGAINTSAALTLRVTKEFKDTSVAKILTLIEESEDKKPKTEKFITKFAKYYTPIVLLIASIIAIIPPLFIGFSTSFAEYLHKGLVFLVISCPCALVISIPLGYFAGIGGASTKGILVKGGNHFESVNTIDCYVFDKTGTLTEGVFNVISVNNTDSGSASYLLQLAAYAEHASNHPIGKSIMAQFHSQLVSTNPSEFSDTANEQSADHSATTADSTQLKLHALDLQRVTDYEEVSGYGVSFRLDGNRILCGNAALLHLNNIIFEEYSVPHGSIVYLSSESDYVGSIHLGDSIRDDSEMIIAQLLTAKKRVIMLSGDNENAVASVAKHLGITEYHHSLLPENKAEIVTGLIQAGFKVAFVGDGLNDAPVLKLATLGICMSGISNDASIEASDIVISGGKIGLISILISKAKLTRQVVIQNIVFSLTVKLAIMIVSLTLLASMWLAIIADVGVSLLAILNSLRAKK